MASTFRGGIHIPGYKLTASLETEKIPSPKTVSIPLSQHIGVPCVATVKPGDSVCKGQIIGTVESGLGCPVHASVSGTVKQITTITVPSGKRIEAVVIENDGENRLSPDIKPLEKDISEVDADDCIKAVRLAGISGMGGATFPTYAKISSALGKVSRIIINCAECEPFITANHRLMLEKPEELIEGLKLLMRIFSVDTGVIAVENNKLDAVEALRNVTGDNTSIEIKVMRTKYPQGDERQLIYALYGTELKAGKLPADVGCVVFNAETCYNIYRAVAEGMPLIERIVTVTGDCVKSPKNLIVPIGTSISELIEYCGGFTEEPNKIVLGGPMMGAATWDMNTPVSKGTNAVLALSKKIQNSSSTPSFSCLHCGKCLTVCPMHLMPLYIAKYSAVDDFKECEKYNALSCVECGSCTYTCPGKVPIVQLIRKAKQKINEEKRSAQGKAKERSGGK